MGANTIWFWNRKYNPSTIWQKFNLTMAMSPTEQYNPHLYGDNKKNNKQIWVKTDRWMVGMTDRRTKGRTDRHTHVGGFMHHGPIYLLWTQGPRSGPRPHFSEAICAPFNAIFQRLVSKILILEQGEIQCLVELVRGERGPNQMQEKILPIGSVKMVGKSSNV